MTTSTPTRMGPRQQKGLTALKSNRTGLTAPQLRDELGLSPDSYGTRQAHALLRDFAEKGWVTKEEMSEKVADKHRLGTTGRKPKTRFKVTAEGKAALKVAS